MPMSNYAMDKFVSQHLSELGACTLPDVAAEFPERPGWYGAFVLKRIFHAHVPDSMASLSITMLRRADAALEEWELARQTLAELATEKTIARYFKALRHLENTVAALYQGYDLARNALSTELFQKNDDSTLERLNFIYNNGRHFSPADLPAGDLHAVWIANDGLHTRKKSVTFDELTEFLRDMGRIATGISTGTHAP
jgi:hypothetical protein